MIPVGTLCITVGAVYAEHGYGRYCETLGSAFTDEWPDGIERTNYLCRIFGYIGVFGSDVWTIAAEHLQPLSAPSIDAQTLRDRELAA